MLGRGCLNYSLILSLGHRAAWHDVNRSFVEILGRIAAVLNLDFRPPSDLALKERKVSGCAQRRTASSILHHGTFLYDFDAGLAERYLLPPERQPPYRQGRPHHEFLANLSMTSDEIRERMADLWDAAAVTPPP